MSKSTQSSPEKTNRYDSVREAARVAHLAKAQAAIDARNARQQAFAAELSVLLRQEQGAELER
ncbi:MAG: hypothetical protein ACAI44_38890 [Candidatus Sericytochromatia bacterium]